MGYFYSPIAGGASFWEESGDDLLSTVDGKVLLLDDTATTTETVAVLTPTTANCGLVIAPTGTGAIMADIPDGAATGGSARGNYAVDLQQDRTYNYEVASANNSVIGGGAGNRAYSTHTGVLGGLNNSVGGNYSIIAGGTSNLTLGWGSFIGGGSGNKVQTSAYASAIAAGYNNEILSGAQYSIIAAGHTNKIFGDSDYSFIGGGRLNEAFAEYNTVAGGYNNAIAGSASDYATISGGQNNDINQCAYGVIAGGTGNDMNNSNSSTISGGTSNFIITSSGCTIAGGTSHNIASGSTNSTISGGSQNDSTAVAGTVVGGLYGLTYLNGQVSNAYGRFSVTGDSQTSRISLRKEITGTTISELFLDGLSIQAVLPSNKTWNANIQLKQGR